MTIDVRGLRRLHGMLEHDGIPEKEDFLLMVEAVFGKYRLPPRIIENAHGYREGTVDLWLKGIVPDKAEWRFILPRVLRGILEHINRAERIAPQSREQAEATDQPFEPNVINLQDRRKPAPPAP